MNERTYATWLIILVCCAARFRNCNNKSICLLFCGHGWNCIGWIAHKGECETCMWFLTVGLDYYRLGVLVTVWIEFECIGIWSMMKIRMYET